ncbi:MAG: glycosyltransferase [Magnetococcus sp. DMHC-8]
MRLLIAFRKPFVALEDALAAAGCVLTRWIPGAHPLPAPEVDGVLVDFCEAARHLTAMWRLRRRLGRRVPVVGIDRDAPWYKGVRRRRLWALRSLRLLDIYASHSLQEAEQFAPRTLYLPNAAQLEWYNLGASTLEGLRDPACYRYPVTFLGNLDARRYREHQPRVRFLETLRQRLAGLGIELTLFHSLEMTPAQQVEVIRASRINLNYGAACDHGGQRSWGLPERCYGIPACGGFLLSDARRHACDDFVPGVEWADFQDLEECVARIRHYLDQFQAARRLAEAACQRVWRDHTYAHRAQRLLETLRAWQSAPLTPPMAVAPGDRR